MDGLKAQAEADITRLLGKVFLVIPCGRKYTTWVQGWGSPLPSRAVPQRQAEEMTQLVKLAMQTWGLTLTFSTHVKTKLF